MRLLDAWLLVHEGVAELVEFANEALVPEYAILSHTWSHEEVLLEDIPKGPNHKISPSASSLRSLRRRQGPDDQETVQVKPHVKAGWSKVRNTCQQACNDGFEYVWIDTCCEPKRRW